MIKRKSQIKNARSGAALILSMIFLAVFSTLGLAMMTMSAANARVAYNHHLTNTATNAALSGLECAKYILQTTPTVSTPRNYVSDAEAQTLWQNLCTNLQNTGLGGAQAFTDANGERIFSGAIGLAGESNSFQFSFYRYDSTNPKKILLESTGTQGNITRKIKMNLDIIKESEVLNYAIVSRGRMWVTQNSVINGPVYSTWNRPEVGAGVETTSDTVIKGSINTVISLENLQDNDIQMETLDENNQPVFDEYGNRVHSSQDCIQGQHEGINYGVADRNTPGTKASDYNTSEYKAVCSTLPSTTRTQVEYFPHAANNYSAPMSSSSKKYTRRVYENQTFSNVKIPKGTNALFKNCTFENVLFVETNTTYQDSATTNNNIRFDGCNFNGAVVSDVPASTNNSTWWMRNVLYFTGEETFNNQSSMQEATILAPNFNVNLGNTGAIETGKTNTLTGAIVGGIVDVRGNADIYGTIISTYDTSAFSTGYITNIGAADDGGSESVGYVGGTITITPNPEQLLPSGITTPIIIKPLSQSYCEIP